MVGVKISRAANSGRPESIVLFVVGELKPIAGSLDDNPWTSIDRWSSSSELAKNTNQQRRQGVSSSQQSAFDQRLTRTR